MIKHADEIPVTYLNKGQAYSIQIADTAPAQPPAERVVKRSKFSIHSRVKVDLK